jgi:hypothetical protein
MKFYWTALLLGMIGTSGLASATPSSPGCDGHLITDNSTKATYCMVQCKYANGYIATFDYLPGTTSTQCEALAHQYEKEFGDQINPIPPGTPGGVIHRWLPDPDGEYFDDNGNPISYAPII